MKPYQGKYTPEDKKKYRGDVNNIIYRSSLELRFFKQCDMRKSVTKWSSEELIIPYVCPVDGRPHRYFPDVVLEVEDVNGKKRVYVVEIKPDSQTRPPNKRKKDYLYEAATWARNNAKWDAAKAYCKKRGWEFKLVTEKNLLPSF